MRFLSLREALRLSRKNINNINYNRLYALADNNNLCISSGLCETTGSTATHVFIVSETKARLLHSFQIFSKNDNSANYLNKTLHWSEFKSFRDEYNLRVFDFGGISINGETSAIDKFKLGFGGQLKDVNIVFSTGRISQKSFYFLVSNIELLLVRNKKKILIFDTCVICLLKKLIAVLDTMC